MTSSSSSSSSTMLKNLLPFCENSQCNDLHTHTTEKPQEKCISIDTISGPASPTTSHDYHYIHYPVDPTVAEPPPPPQTIAEVSLQNFVVSGQSPQPQHDTSLNRTASVTENENNDNMQIFNNIGMATVTPTEEPVAAGEVVASVTVHNNNNQQQAISHPQNHHHQTSMHHHNHNNHQHHPSIDDNNAIDISPSYPCCCGRPVEKDSNIVGGVVDDGNVITASHQRKGHHL